MDDFDFSIRGQDIFQSGAEVIVNAANIISVEEAVLMDLIHSKGGNRYAQEHRKLQTHYNSNYVNGYAVMITSGSIATTNDTNSIKNVIVVAGPIYDQSKLQEQKDQLYSCYYNSLVLAHVNNKKSIAFPMISTGIFRFPKDLAASISLRAVKDFCDKYPDTTLKTISIHYIAKPSFFDEVDPYRDALK